MNSLSLKKVIQDLPQEERERLNNKLKLDYRLNIISKDIEKDFIDSCQRIGQNILGTPVNEFIGKTTQISLLDSFFYRTHVIENESRSSFYLCELLSLSVQLVDKIHYEAEFLDELDVIVLYSNNLELRQFNQILVFPKSKRNELLKKYNVDPKAKISQFNDGRFVSNWGNKNGIEIWSSDVDFTKIRENRVQDEIYFDKKANYVLSLEQFVKIGNKIVDAMKLSKKEYNKKYKIKI